MTKPKNAFSIAFTRQRTMATCMAVEVPHDGDTYYLKAKGDRSACHIGYAVVSRPGVIKVYTAAWNFAGQAATRRKAVAMLDSYHGRKNRARYSGWLEKAAVVRRADDPTGETEVDQMTNRITPYEAGWLQMLLDRGLADEKDLREAQARVARAAVDELMARRAAKRREKRKRKDQ